MPDFRCPQCSGTSSTRWAVPHPLILHWILNPGIVFNELVLGQRLPMEMYVCESCTVPTTQRGYVGCPHCGTWHSSLLWSQRRAFGNWLGYVCPTCGGPIDCLWNVWSLLILAVTVPIWWLPVKYYAAPWRAWQRQRMRHVNAADTVVQLGRVKWIRIGVFAWGIPVGLVFSLVMASVAELVVPGRYWQHVSFLLAFMPIWILAGVGFGLGMKWMMTRWGVPVDRDP